MTPGSLEVRGTVWGFLFFGWSYQHCWFVPEEGPAEMCVSNKLGSRAKHPDSGAFREAHKCQNCGTLIAPGDAVELGNATDTLSTQRLNAPAMGEQEARDLRVDPSRGSSETRLRGPGGMNALNVIFPYRHEGMWVFDDADVGLDKEPFVEGADLIIDRAVAAKNIKNADSGFRLLFSAAEFPHYDVKFRWLREADGGNYYAAEGSDLEGWLCPALFMYFDEAPREIYARFEPKST